MQIKETPNMRVLSVRRRIAIPEVRTAAAQLAPAIEAEVSRSSMNVVGPWIFISHGLPKDGRTLFDWRICRPVARTPVYSGAFDLLHLEPVMVAASLYRGQLRTLYTHGYAPLIAAVETARHEFSGESREIYHDWHGEKSERNRIEIQFVLRR